MKRFFVVALIVLWTSTCWAGVPALVERHIFTPEADSKATVKEGPQSAEAVKLEKEIEFTGVIITRSKKVAMMREKKTQPGDDSGIGRYREGESVLGYTVKTIGRNYVLLASADKTVRLDLYRGAKNRPAPPPAPPELAAETATGANTGQPAPGSAAPGTGKAPAPGSVKKPPVGARAQAGKPAPGKTEPNASSSSSAPATNPFAEALKRAMQNQKAANTPAAPATPGTNAFLDAIRRARGY